MSGIRLYEVTDKIIDAQHDAESIDTDALDALTVQFDVKIVACSHVVKNLEAEQKAIDAEIERLRTMKNTRRRNVQDLKSYMLACMKKIGIKEAQVGIHKVRVQKNSRLSITIVNTDRIPARFLKKTVTVTADKNRIEAEIKETGEVPDGIVISHDEHIRIK